MWWMYLTRSYTPIVLIYHYFFSLLRITLVPNELSGSQVGKAIRRLKIVYGTHPEGSQWSIDANMWILSHVVATTFPCGDNKVSAQDFEVRRKSQPNTDKILTQNLKCFTCLVSKDAVLIDGEWIKPAFGKHHVPRTFGCGVSLLRYSNCFIRWILTWAICLLLIISQKIILMEITSSQGFRGTWN